MKARILTWTRVLRPPAGIPEGQAVVLAEGDGQRVYALWKRADEPRIGMDVQLAREADGWIAREDGG